MSNSKLGNIFTRYTEYLEMVRVYNRRWPRYPEPLYPTDEGFNNFLRRGTVWVIPPEFYKPHTPSPEEFQQEYSNTWLTVAPDGFQGEEISTPYGVVLNIQLDKSR